MDHNSQNIDLIKNCFAYLFLLLFLSFLDNLLYDVDTIFQKGADDFETEHKTC